MKRCFRLLPFAACTVCLFAACSGGDKKDSTPAEPAIDLTAMDTTVRPGDDFYRYCNGNWIKKNPLKPENSRYGSFDILRDSSEARVRRIVEGLADKDQKAGTSEYKVALLYRQTMDSTARNKMAAEPIRPLLKEVDAIADKAALTAYLAKDHNRGGGFLFGTYVAASAENSNLNIFHLSQTGLMMGNRDYYIENDSTSRNLRNAYLGYVSQICKLAGLDDAAAKRIATNSLKVETELARMCYTNVELRDSHKNFNLREVKPYVASNKGFDWNTYLKARSLDTLTTFDVGQIGYFDKFAKWYASAPLDVTKDYITAQIIDGAASYLSDDFVAASFDFFGRTMNGTPEMRPRWKRAIGLVEDVLGEPLGQIYVEKYFPAEAKERMLALVKNLQQALSQRIAALPWMSAETKQKAQEKLSSFAVKIGYPDKWRDYSGLEIKNDNLYANILRAAQFEHNYNMSFLGKPVDRARWHMTPQTVNAYYDPTTNEICFPAGILQPPFFNMNADDAVNYGAIGVVIGHEMTHGFDDEGCNFDKDGNMKNWWTDEDRSKFNVATKKLIHQFDQILIAPSIHANGALTLGENIADQGGLLVAHLALHNALKDKKAEPIDRFTPDQRFFIAYSRVWGQNIRSEAALRLTKIDPHSLGEWRVNQTLCNIDAFYKAFDVKPGDKMYLAPEERVVVW